MTNNRERIYIVGPYTPTNCSLHNASRIAQQNVDRAIAKANELIRMGYYVFVPHLSHFIHIHRTSSNDLGEEWMNQDFSFIEHWATGIYLLPGWTKSIGSLQEYNLAKKLGLRIYGEGTEIYNLEWKQKKDKR